MHSLKNTVIAVGLLGLSFVFYQASSKPAADDGLSIPVLEVSEGLEGVNEFTNNLANSAKSSMNAAQDSFDAVKSQLKAPNMGSNGSSINVPDLPLDLNAPKKAVSDFANNVTAKANNFASDLKSKANSKLQDISKAANSFGSTNQFTQPNTQPDTQFSTQPKLSSNGSIQPQQSNTTAVSRDQGLINALNTQNQNTAAVNDFAANNQFISQPDNTSDSSFNQLAGNETSNDHSMVSHVGAQPDQTSFTFDTVWAEVDRQVAAENFREALQLLTNFYRDQNLTGPQRQRLTGWLDALAGKVIFSTEHHLIPQPYTTSGESIAEVANRWNVPPQLIYNINKSILPNMGGMANGTQLKQVQGPFSAEIDLEKKVMTMFLGDLYAGRYPIRVGISGTPRPGKFDVMIKSEKGHQWRDVQGKVYPIGAPENGYGRYWIGISGSLCIHAVKESTGDGHHGCIGLSESDAKDVFAILGKGSSISIR